MKSLSKFWGIQFPIFCLKKTPYKYSVRLDTITIQKTEEEKPSTVDQFDSSVPLLNRYIKVKDDSFAFDYTCLNLSQLITKRIEWGIDSTARAFDFRKLQTFKARNVKIRRLKGNLIWVDTVTYPYKIPQHSVSPELLDQYVTIVYVDNVWYLYRFTSFSEKVKTLKL